MYVLQVKYPFFLSHILTKLEFSNQSFEKYTNIKFRNNPSSGSQDVPCGRTDIMKLIVPFAILRTHLKTSYAGVLSVQPNLEDKCIFCSCISMGPFSNF